MNNKDWLKQLKAGDEVVGDFGRYSYSEYRLLKVKRITPTGFIVCSDGENEYRFSKDGSMKMGDWHWVNLFQATDKLKEKIIYYSKFRKAKDKLNKFANKVNNLSEYSEFEHDALLFQIEELINEYEQKQH